MGCRGLGRGRAGAGEGGAWSRLEDPARGAVGAWPTLWVSIVGLGAQVSAQQAGPEAGHGAKGSPAMLRPEGGNASPEHHLLPAQHEILCFFKDGMGLPWWSTG